MNRAARSSRVLLRMLHEVFDALILLKGTTSWSKHQPTMGAKSSLGLDLLNGAVTPREGATDWDPIFNAILKKGTLERKKVRGRCGHSLYYRADGHWRPYIEQQKVMDFVAKAYRSERIVQFTLGDPVLYTDCWVCWYGDAGFIVQCDVKKGYLYFPWRFCPTDIKYV